MAKTKIEWTEENWNPMRGCTRVSPGCGGPGPHGGCYAEAIAARFSGPGLPYHGLATMTGGKPRWTGRVAFVDDRLLEPLRRKKPTTWFVNSMSDTFHENVPDEWIDKLFAVMALCPQHTFQVLTKRAERMRDYFRGLGRFGCWDAAARSFGYALSYEGIYTSSVPLPNVWLGVSVEDQTRADERIPHLLATPAAVRWVSAEPLLSRMDLCEALGMWWNQTMGCFEANGRSGFNRNPNNSAETALDWVVAGAESGRLARQMAEHWARSLRDQCKAANVKFFMKQLSGPGGKAVKDIDLFPSDLRIREYPR